MRCSSRSTPSSASAPRRDPAVARRAAEGSAAWARLAALAWLGAALAAGPVATAQQPGDGPSAEGPDPAGPPAAGPASPGRPLRPAPVIRAGDRVRVVARIGGLEAVLIGIAEQSGRPQQIIRVVNPDSRRAIKG